MSSNLPRRRVLWAASQALGLCEPRDDCAAAIKLGGTVSAASTSIGRRSFVTRSSEQLSSACSFASQSGHASTWPATWLNSASDRLPTRNSDSSLGSGQEAITAPRAPPHYRDEQRNRSNYDNVETL